MEVLVNAAMSADGKLSSVLREQIPISGQADFDRVHRMRREVGAILVGVGTVLADDPSLAIRDGAFNGPIRVVLDSTARTPPTARILDGEQETILIVTARAPSDRTDALIDAGATVVSHGNEQVEIADVMVTLEDRGVDRVLIEGGGEVLFSCFATGVVDELSVFIGPIIIGGRDAPTLADGPGFADPDRFPDLVLRDVSRLDGGVLLRWRVI